MSVTSIATSFSYVNPASVGGPTPQATSDSDTDASGMPARNSSDASGQTPATAKATSTAAPVFSSDATAALMHIQEHDAVMPASAKAYG
jgi:hypothetical protein